MGSSLLSGQDGPDDNGPGLLGARGIERLSVELRELGAPVCDDYGGKVGR
jgi:hypothetical protein